MNILIFLVLQLKNSSRPKCRARPSPTKPPATVTPVPPPENTDIPKPPINENNTTGMIYGIGYNAKHSTGGCSDLQKVVNDFNFIKKYTSRVRTFGLFDCNQGPLLIQAAKQTGIALSLGVFVNQYEQEFNNEMNVLKSMIENYRDAFSNVEYLIVGSESFYRKENTLDQMANYVNRARDILNNNNIKNVKVTSADIKDSWYPSSLTNAVDAMFVNAYPYWEGVPIDDAVDQIFQKIQEVIQRVPNKEFILGETGWPEGGKIVGASHPSKENQIKYFKKFVCKAKQMNLKYYWFSAFDESWKQNEEKMNWGVFKESLQLKDGYPDPLVSC